MNNNYHTLLNQLVLIIMLCTCSRESLVSVVTRALEESDVLITTGGVSMGEKVTQYMYSYIRTPEKISLILVLILS